MTILSPNDLGCKMILGPRQTKNSINWDNDIVSWWL